MVLESNYVNNKLEGRWARYRYGKTTEEANYKNGQLDGLYKIYNVDAAGKSSIQKEAEYKDGKQHGYFKAYDPAGNLIVSYQYENGQKVSGGAVE